MRDHIRSNPTPTCPPPCRGRDPDAGSPFDVGSALSTKSLPLKGGGQVGVGQTRAQRKRRRGIASLSAKHWGRWQSAQRTDGGGKPHAPPQPRPRAQNLAPNALKSRTTPSDLRQKWNRSNFLLQMRTTPSISAATVLVSAGIAGPKQNILEIRHARRWPETPRF